ncbi:MAG: OpgC domain-containing protein, partial [Hyphomicrobium sp.]|nr:OpgC domain-containing protein [Hyphomicrobium sp.]
VIGIAATLHVKRGSQICFSAPLACSALIYVVLSLVWVRTPLWGLEKTVDLPVVLAGFDKTFLSLPRLLHVLAPVTAATGLRGITSSSSHRVAAKLSAHLSSFITWLAVRLPS